MKIFGIKAITKTKYLPIYYFSNLNKLQNKTNLSEAKKQKSLQRENNNNKISKELNKKQTQAYNHQFYTRFLTMSVSAPLIVSFGAIVTNTFIFDISSIISSSYLMKCCLCSNMFLQTYIYGGKLNDMSEDFESFDEKEKEEYYTNHANYNYIVYPVIFIMVYSQYIIYKKKFTLKDSLVLSTLNLINPLTYINRKLTLNSYFSRVSLVASGVSTIILILTYMIYKDKQIENDLNEKGIVNLLSIYDLIEEDNKKLVKENEMFHKYYNKIIN